jgi:hypothetical protein
VPPTQLTAEQILEAFQFVRVGPDPKRGNQIAWVYQEHLPNVRIYLPLDPSVPSVLYAIYDAGANTLRKRWGEHRTAEENLMKPTNSTTFESAPSEPLTTG